MEVKSILVSKNLEAYENGALFPQEELHLLIASLLDYKSLLTSSLTCKRWHRINSDHSIIQSFFREKFPDSYVRSKDKIFQRKELVDAALYVKRLKSDDFMPSCNTISEAHKDSIKSLQIFQGILYSASVDGQLKIWQLENFTPIQNLQVENWILCLAFNEDKIYAGSTSGFIYSWDKKGSLLKKFKAHNWNVTALRVHENKLYSGSLDQTIKVWDSDLKNAIKVLQHEGGSVEDVQIFNDEIYGISKGGILGIWSLRDKMKNHRYWNIKNDWIISSNLTRGIFYFATQEGKIGLINLSESSENRIWNAHDDIVTCLEVSNGLLFSGSLDQTIGVWEAKTGKPFRKIPCESKISSIKAMLGKIIVGTACGKIHILDFL